MHKSLFYSVSKEFVYEERNMYICATLQYTPYPISSVLPLLTLPPAVSLETFTFHLVVAADSRETRTSREAMTSQLTLM